MCNELRIDFVAPPYGGHLFPLFDLANQLRERGFTNLRFVSTPEAASATELSGFHLQRLLVGSSHTVMAISDTNERVGSNPFRLLRQLKMNLSLMDQLRSELREIWTSSPPDLVIVDFTVPVAGLLAESLGIGWWTALPTLCVLDSRNGTPAYLGGWQPARGWAGEVRNWSGRKLVRTFKRTVHRMFRAQMKGLGVERIYRDDGSEFIYSSDTILGFGIQELEFPRTWPGALRFVGPMSSSPPYPHTEPEFTPGRPHVLISLGTHLHWVKSQGADLLSKVAALMPECVFHFTHGQHSQGEKPRQENFFQYHYLPYDRYMSRYAAVIHHGGTGVLYSCLQHAVPALVWPQDFDQFDHCARLVHHGLARRLKPDPAIIAEDLQRMFGDPQLRQRLNECRTTIASYKTADLVIDHLTRWSTTRGCP